METGRFLMKVKKISLNTKLATVFFILFILVVSVKVLSSTFSKQTGAMLSLSEIKSIRNSLTKECLKQEEISLNKGDNLDEDLEWFKTKAPSYCNCISLRVYSMALQEQDFKEMLIERRKKQFKSEIISLMNSEKAKWVTDFCLSKAQRNTKPKRSYASEKK
ncbi:MAG: hypothetical protein KDD45_16965 [Bdellovibrionales bacterium]|nr:hypothetical protein [Bdellovibrionales bacterium]